MANETEKPAVTTLGVIDIGTNSIRLNIAELQGDGTTAILERARRPVRLGRDTFVRGQISRSTMNAAIAILRDYKNILETYRVDRVRTVATSAVREATNTDAFVDRVFVSVGLDAEVIEPTEELRLTVRAVRRAAGEKHLQKGHALILDVGGGSTLAGLLKNGQLINSGSYALGSIRLQEALETAAEPPHRAADMLRQQIGSVVAAMKDSLPLNKVRTVIAVGGDARFAASQAGKEGPTEHVSILDREDLKALISGCTEHSPARLAKKYRLPFAEAETIVPALLVLQSVVGATGARQIDVADVSMRDGILMEMAGEATGRKDSEVFAEIFLAARTLAQRYHCDMEHADHVMELATGLYDKLESELRLPPRCRMLLEVAAILHEVGGFISGRAHHKHSYYILSNSEIFGLRADEKEIVANTARYHRRSMPKKSHLPYVTLSRENRVIVSKLAAILRVADALDRGHCRHVSDLTVERSNDEFILHIPGATDLALERRALERKADLFEDIFGLKVRLEEG